MANGSERCACGAVALAHVDATAATPDVDESASQHGFDLCIGYSAAGNPIGWERGVCR